MRLFSEDAIGFLRDLIHDPAATYDFELLSGAVFWSDERLLEFIARFCGRVRHRSHGKELFAYRTSLLVGKPREALRPAWDEVRRDARSGSGSGLSGSHRLPTGRRP